MYNSHPSERPAEGILRHIVETVLQAEGAEEGAISVVLCDRTSHRKLHLEHLDKDYATDVLAFDLGSKGNLEGEIYVDLDTARERHEEFDSTFEEEVARYVIHGTLHLLGHDHELPDEARRMRAQERRLWRALCS